MRVRSPRTRDHSSRYPSWCLSPALHVGRFTYSSHNCFNPRSCRRAKLRHRCRDSSRSINPEETVATANTSGVQLLRKLESLEHRLEILATRVKGLERHTAELDDLRREIGNLKVEVEEFREAD